jgi:predicted DNA-binding transcriptional regulator AlpA
MENPFEIINQRLECIELLLESILKGDQKTDVSKIMDIVQLSKYLNLSKSCIYKYTQSRNIPHSKKGKKLYFEKYLIDSWVLEGKIRTQQELEEESSKYTLKRKFKY